MRIPFLPGSSPIGKALVLAALLFFASSPLAGGTADAAEAPTPPAATSAAPPAPADIAPQKAGTLLQPFLGWRLDPSGRKTVEEISQEAAQNAGAFARFDPQSLPRQAGTMWLRLRLSPAAQGAQGAQGAQDAQAAPARDLCLDLGDQTPRARLWTIRPGQPPAPLPGAPGNEGIFPLAALAGGGEILIRLDGLPGLWFSPALREFSSAVTAPERRVHALTLAALTVLLLLCLVRSITERGDGRFWAGIFAAAALVQAMWSMPATPMGKVTPLSMPGILAAAVALMLLPHVGRNIMRTRESRADTLLLILALPGAALALLPLLPGLAWTARWLLLWPLGAAFALAPALALLWRGVPGSGFFTLACLGMAGGGALALFGADAGMSAPLWGQGPLLGVTLATLLLAAAAPQSAYAQPEAEDLDDEAPAPPGHADFLSLDRPADRAPGLTLFPHGGGHTRPAARAGATADAAGGAPQSPPLDALLRAAVALDQSLDQALDQVSGHTPDKAAAGQALRDARAHADALVAAGRDLARPKATGTDAPREALPVPGAPSGRFDLFALVREAIDAVAAAQHNEGGRAALSWYIAPHLGRWYRGDEAGLRLVLSLLLGDAARAAQSGVIGLRVRRADMSPNPGHLQFTVTDTGRDPLRRDGLHLAKVWELATAHNGALFVDSTPHGAEITFTLDCVALEDDGVTALAVTPPESVLHAESLPPDPRLVILASAVPLNRHMLAFYLSGTGQTVWEALDPEETVALYVHTPAALVIMDGNAPEEELIAAIAAIRAFEGENSLPACPFLALCGDESQAARLHQAGYDHSLPLPVSRGEFRAMALYLASPSGVRPRPVLAPRRATPAAPRPETPRADLQDREFRVVAPLPPEPTVPAPTVPEPALPEPALPETTPEPTTEATPPAPGLFLPEHVEEPLLTEPEIALLTAPSPAMPTPAENGEPAQPESAQPEPALPEPALPEPAQPEPALPEPSQSGFFRPEAEPVEAALPEPAQPEPTLPEPPAAATAPPAPRPARPTPSGPPQGLLIAPAPKKRFQWLERFKPTPKVREEAAINAEQDWPGAEWVGDPTPLGFSPEPAARTAEPAETALAATPAAAPPAAPARPRPGRQDAYLSLSVPEPDDGEAVGEPIPLARPAPETAGLSLAAPARNDRLELAAPAAISAPAPQTPPAAAATAAAEPLSLTPRPAPSGPSASSSAKRRKKSRLEDLPFLSLDPNYIPPHGTAQSAGADTPEPLLLTGEESGEDSDILDLTESDMLDSPLLQELPDMLRGLNAALEHATDALTRRDAFALTGAASRMADRARAFGLHALCDAALCLEEAARLEDWDTVAQLLPDVRAEIDRNHI